MTLSQRVNEAVGLAISDDNPSLTYISTSLNSILPLTPASSA